MTRSRVRFANSDIRDTYADQGDQTPSTRRIRSLLRDFAWSGRNLGTRASQWSCYVQFCDEEGRAPLTATEAQILAFVGWLANERDAARGTATAEPQSGRRDVSTVSLPQYISAVRHMHMKLLGCVAPPAPFVSHAIRAYARWEELTHPTPERRAGLSASTVQQIWTHGMTDNVSITDLRAATAVLLAFCLGLRESSVLTLQSHNVHVDVNQISIRPSVIKGKNASQQQDLSYHRVGAFPSPIDLFLRWHQAQGPHPLWLATTTDNIPLPAQSLTRYLSRMTKAVGHTTRPGTKMTSHSIRIGSHTEMVLLGYPLEVRLARFGWKEPSSEMAALNFDRTLRSSASSLWGFGAPPHLRSPTDHPIAPSGSAE